MLTSIGGGLARVGLTPHQIEGDNVLDMFPEHKEDLLKALNGESVSFVSTHSYQGETICFQNFYFFNNLRNEGAYGLLIDITELRQAEKKLEEIQEFVFLSDAVPQIIFATLADGTADYYNQQWFEYTGLSKEDMLAGKGRLVLHPEDRQRTLDTWQDALQRGQKYEIEHRLIDKNGNIRWHITRALPMKNEQGVIRKWFGSSTDIDDLKKTSQTLHSLNQQFSQLADAMPIVVWITDSQGYTEYFNKKWYTYTGLHVTESLGMGFLTVVHPEDREQTAQVWKTAVEQQSDYIIEYRWRNSTGHYRWFLGRGLPIRDEQGKIIKWIGTSTDIQEQKEIEEHKDTFLRIAGHELRTPLTTLLGYLSLAKKIPFDNSLLTSYLLKAYQASIKMKNLIQDFMEFNKAQMGVMKFQVSEFDLDELLREVISNIESSTTHHRIVVNGATRSKISRG
ncbi:MAG: PAS domain-containing sensor histidine kinase [Bacteroidia bacterium]|nr:PAS domain-containing sensor histidine kinase [Bacteroidia bacterium]